MPRLTDRRPLFSGGIIDIFVNNQSTGSASICNASSDRYLRSDC